MKTRQILAISGGGFSKEENAPIDQNLLSLCPKKTPKRICFIPTASHDAIGYVEKFLHAFQSEETSYLLQEDFIKPTIQQIVNSFDIIYVGGGNTQYMLKVWRETGFDQVLIKAYQAGVILSGISAGAMCWFEDCFSESETGFEAFKGLGILKGSLCPHYNDEERRNAYDQWVEQHSISPCFKLQDHENVHFINEKYTNTIVY